MTNGDILNVAPGDTVTVPAGVTIQILDDDGLEFAVAGPGTADFVLKGVKGLTFVVVGS